MFRLLFYLQQLVFVKPLEVNISNDNQRFKNYFREAAMKKSTHFASRGKNKQSPLLSILIQNKFLHIYTDLKLGVNTHVTSVTATIKFQPSRWHCNSRVYSLEQCSKMNSAPPCAQMALPSMLLFVALIQGSFDSMINLNNRILFYEALLNRSIVCTALKWVDNG